MTIVPARAKKLPRTERRKQLLEMARSLLKEEGANGLTLGSLAIRAGVSKPIVYDHFVSRNGLLVQLYKLIDEELSTEMQQALTVGSQTFPHRVRDLAISYMQCASDTSGEWHLVRAALAGSIEEVVVGRELLAGYVQMFVNVLTPYLVVSREELYLQCIGLVGAADALSIAMLQEKYQLEDAVNTLTNQIINSLSMYLSRK